MSAKKKSGSRPKSNPQSYVQSTFSTFVMIVAFVGLIVLGWFAYEEGKYPSDLSELPLIKKNQNPFKIKPENPGGLVVNNKDREIFNTISDSAEKVNVEEENKYAKLLPLPEEPITIEELESTKFSDIPEDVKKIINDDTASRVKKYRLTSTGTKKLSDYLEKEKETPNINDKKDNKSSDNNEWESITRNIESGISGDKVNYEKIEIKRIMTKIGIKKSKKTGRKIIQLSAIPNKPLVNKNNTTKSSYERIKQNVSAVRHINAIKGVKIQLGSFKSVSSLQKNWKSIKNKFSKQLRNIDYNIEKVDLGVKGIFYRLQAGSIRSKSAAEKLCDILVRKRQGCFVVREK